MTTFGPETQVDDGTPLEVRSFSGGALGDNDRFQFRGMPVATAPDSTGFGVGFVGQQKRPSIFGMAITSVIASAKPV